MDLETVNAKVMDKWKGGQASWRVVGNIGGIVRMRLNNRSRKSWKGIGLYSGVMEKLLAGLKQM